jgi:uncharacterized membrane protein YqjE
VSGVQFLVRRMFPPLLRHLGGYLDLFELEMKEAAAMMRRRLVWGVIGFISALLTLNLVVVWIVLAAWSSSNRLWVVGGLTAVFAITAVGAVCAAARGRSGMFRRLRAEWSTDRKLFPGLGSAAPGEEHDAARA